MDVSTSFSTQLHNVAGSHPFFFVAQMHAWCIVYKCMHGALCTSHNQTPSFCSFKMLHKRMNKSWGYLPLVLRCAKHSHQLTEKPFNAIVNKTRGQTQLLLNKFTHVTHGSVQLFPTMAAGSFVDTFYISCLHVCVFLCFCLCSISLCLI